MGNMEYPENVLWKIYNIVNNMIDCIINIQSAIISRQTRIFKFLVSNVKECSFWVQNFR